MSTDPEVALALALARNRETLLSVGLSLVAASHRVDQDDDLSTYGAIYDEIRKRGAGIDSIPLIRIWRALGAVIALRSGIPPQRLLEEEFKIAPGEEAWRLAIDTAREQQRLHEGRNDDA